MYDHPDSHLLEQRELELREANILIGLLVEDLGGVVSIPRKRFRVFDKKLTRMTDSEREQVTFRLTK